MVQTVAMSAPTMQTNASYVSKNADLTIYFSVYPYEVQKKDGVDVALSLDDLEGFSVDLMKEFVQNHGINVSLKELSGKYAENQAHHLPLQRKTHDGKEDVMIMNLVVPSKELMQNYHPSQPVVMFSGALVYLQEENSSYQDLMSALVQIYFVIISMFLLFGALILFVIYKLEIPDKGHGYGEMIWSFLLSPFGMIGDALLNRPSGKILAFSWAFVWLLILTSFSAEFSSKMTVDKLQNDLDSFSKVLALTTRKFVWFKETKDVKYKIIADLRKKYKKYRDNNEDYSKYETLKNLTSLAEMTKYFLEEKNHILLCCLVDMRLFSQLTFSDRIVVKKDWSVPFIFLYKFITTESESNVLKNFNMFLEDKKNDGSLEDLKKEWFDFDLTGEKHEKSKLTMFFDIIWRYWIMIKVAAGMALFGSFVAIMVSFRYYCKRKPFDHGAEPMQFVGQITKKRVGTTMCTRV